MCIYHGVEVFFSFKYKIRVKDGKKRQKLPENGRKKKSVIFEEVETSLF